MHYREQLSSSFCIANEFLGKIGSHLDSFYTVILIKQFVAIFIIYFTPLKTKNKQTNKTKTKQQQQQKETTYI